MLNQDENTHLTLNTIREFWVKNTLQNTTFWAYSGRLLTGAFVAPAGFYSALFVDNLAKKMNPAIRLIPDAIAGFTATAGKYALMNSLNEEAFKGLAQVNCEQTFTHLKRNSLTNIMIYALTLSVCGTFAYLGLVSLAETAKLSETYHTKDGDRFAQFIDSYPIQGIVAFASIFCNLLTFQHIIPGAFAQLKNLLLSLFASSVAQKTYLLEQAKVTYAANALVTEFNALMTKLKENDTLEPDYQAIYTLVCGIVNVSEDQNIFDTAKNKLRDLLQNSYMQNKQVMMTVDTIKNNLLNQASTYTPAPSEALARISALITLSVVTLTIMGLTNFWDIANDLGKKLGFGQYDLIIGITSMIAISLLGATTLSFKPYIDGLLLSELRKKPISIINKNTTWRLNVSAHLICLAGGTANGYQSLALAHQSYFLIGASILSSYLLEINGTLALFQKSAEKAAIKKLNNRCDYIEELNQLVQQVSTIEATPPTYNRSKKISLRFPFIANLGKKSNSQLTTPILLQQPGSETNPMLNDMRIFTTNV